MKGMRFLTLTIVIITALRMGNSIAIAQECTPGADRNKECMVLQQRYEKECFRGCQFLNKPSKDSDENDLPARFPGDDFKPCGNAEKIDSHGHPAYRCSCCRAVQPQEQK